jgi:acetyl-CoA carboxylase biotin carboxyl carrier protein
MNYDPKAIEALAKLLETCNLSEIEVTDNAQKIRVARQHSVQHTAPVPQAPAPTATPAAPQPELHSGTTVKSPMVGTVYLAPSPGAAAFVQVGQTVAPGEVLCLIEAMKMFNKIKAEKGGVIKKILLSNEQPVEFGAPLFIIDESHA